MRSICHLERQIHQWLTIMPHHVETNDCPSFAERLSVMALLKGRGGEYLPFGGTGRYVERLLMDCMPSVWFKLLRQQHHSRLYSGCRDLHAIGAVVKAFDADVPLASCSLGLWTLL